MAQSMNTHNSTPPQSLEQSTGQSTSMLRRLWPALVFAGILTALVAYFYEKNTHLPHNIPSITNNTSNTASRYNTAKTIFAKYRQAPVGIVKRAQWTSLANEFYDIYAKDTTWPNRPAALFRHAAVMEALGRRSTSKNDLRAALTSYENMVKEFPQSVLADDALLQMAHILAGPLQDAPRAQSVLQRLMHSYPKGDMHLIASRMSKDLKKLHGETPLQARITEHETRTPVHHNVTPSLVHAPSSATDTAPPVAGTHATPAVIRTPLNTEQEANTLPAHLTQVSWKTLNSENVQIIVALDKDTAWRIAHDKRIGGHPSRLLLLMDKTVPAKGIQGGARIRNSVLKHVSIAHKNGATILALDFDGTPQYTSSIEIDPYRIVLNISASKTSYSAVAAASTRSPLPVREQDSTKPQAVQEAVAQKPAQDEAHNEQARIVLDTLPREKMSAAENLLAAHSTANFLQSAPTISPPPNSLATFFDDTASQEVKLQMVLQAEQERIKAENEKRRQLAQEERRKELAMKAEQQRLKKLAEQKAEQERQKELAQKKEEARQRRIAELAEEARQKDIALRAEQQRKEELAQKAEKEHQRALALEAELARQKALTQKAEEERQKAIEKMMAEARQKEMALMAENERQEALTREAERALQVALEENAEQLAQQQRRNEANVLDESLVDTSTVTHLAVVNGSEITAPAVGMQDLTTNDTPESSKNLPALGDMAAFENANDFGNNALYAAAQLPPELPAAIPTLASMSADDASAHAQVTVIPPSEEILSQRLNAAQTDNLAAQLGLSVQTIFIDAGHGGRDPGAVNNGIVERDIVLDVSKRVGRILSAKGLTVVYSRTQDNTLALSARPSHANAAQADVFVSIHVNAIPHDHVHGFETYYLDFSKNTETAQVAALENATSDRKLGDIQSLVADVMLNVRTAESTHLASDIQNAAMQHIKKSGYKTRNGGTRSAPFHVLIGTNMPAVLVELGYSTNKTEAKKLLTAEYRQVLAEGIAGGILSYKGRLQNSVHVAAQEAENVAALSATQ